jgi:hypothetical protein
MEFVFEDGRAHPESYVLSGVFFKNFTLAPITRRLEAKEKWTVFDRYPVFDRYVVPLIGIPASTHPPEWMCDFGKEARMARPYRRTRTNKNKHVERLRLTELRGGHIFRGDARTASNRNLRGQNRAPP